MKKETTKKYDEEIAELTADLQRTRADFENYRKQMDAQKIAERRSAKLATVYKFLPLIDDMGRAIEAYKELAPLAKTLEKTMKELGVSRIDSSEGTEFNPDLFEAVMVEGEGEREVVGETLRPGSIYEEEILRPAMVKVKKI